MKEVIKTEVFIDTSSIQGKVDDLVTDDEVLTEVNRAFSKIIDPWIPYDTGRLSKDLTITAEGVTYNAEYAAKQYYGDEFHHKQTVHPLATAHWDEVAMQTEMTTLIQQVKEILIRRIKSGR